MFSGKILLKIFDQTKKKNKTKQNKTKQNITKQKQKTKHQEYNGVGQYISQPSNYRIYTTMASLKEKLSLSEINIVYQAKHLVFQEKPFLSSFLLFLQMINLVFSQIDLVFQRKKHVL